MLNYTVHAMESMTEIPQEGGFASYPADATFFLPDTAGAEIYPAVAPLAGEPVITKQFPLWRPSERSMHK